MGGGERANGLWWLTHSRDAEVRCLHFSFAGGTAQPQLPVERRKAATDLVTLVREVVYRRFGVGAYIMR